VIFCSSAAASGSVGAGKAVAIPRKACDFFFVQTMPQRHALKAASLLEQAAESLHVFRCDLDELAELAQQRIHVLDVFGNHLQGESGRILRERHAVAVVDQATGRRQCDDLDPVVLGQGAEVLVLHYLQLDHAQHQQSREQQNPEAGRDHPSSDDAGLCRDVLYGVNRPHSARASSAIAPGIALPPASDRHGWRECRGLSGTIPALQSCFVLPRPSDRH